MMSEIEEEVKQVIAETLELDGESEINGSDEISTLGIDSIKFMNLLIGLEDVIGKDIEDVIEDVDFSDLKTIDDVVKFVIAAKEN